MRLRRANQRISPFRSQRGCGIVPAPRLPAAGEKIPRRSDGTLKRVKPHRTLLFDCSYAISRQRLEASGKQLDRFERQDQGFFERVRNAYLSLARAEPARVRVIDAAADIARIRRQLQQALGFE